MRSIHPILLYVSAFAWLGFCPRPAAEINSLRRLVSPSVALPGSMITSVTGSLYYELGLRKHGLTAEAFRYAMHGYQLLQQQHRLPNNQYITICDMSQSSGRKRLYLIDVRTHRLVMNTCVAHGRNSGGQYATHFSNTPESLQSSLGFYITSGTYQGANGLSLRLKGMEPGFNDRAWERNIVVHGADYVEAGPVSNGRSYGCPAVPLKDCQKLIALIRNGSCLFIYHPQAEYTKHSKLLND